MIKNKENIKILLKVILINFGIFALTNILFNLNYDDVDDFIIYSLYSGLDGTFNWHGVYMYPVLCMILGLFYRVNSVINWHTIFLISMEFVCFASIGYILLKKNKNSILANIGYITFAGAFFSIVLIALQYTIVAALLIGTSLFILLYTIDNKVGKKYNIISAILFTIGIMTRIQSLLIVVPFFGIYGLNYFIKWKLKKETSQKFVKLIKNYAIFILITVIIYMSNSLIYNSNSVYKKYTEYNKLRTFLLDNSNVQYYENKEVFDEVNWSENDYFMFFSLNFADENIYNIPNLNKIVENTQNRRNLETNVKKIINEFKYQIMQKKYNVLFVLCTALYIMSLTNYKKNKILNISVFIAIIGTNLLFIVISRNLFRVVLPEYIIGFSLILYNIEFWKRESLSNNLIIDKLAKGIIYVWCIVVITFGVGKIYSSKNTPRNFEIYKDLINYTSSHKENAYLSSVPAIQNRFLVYSIYEMPPKNSFSNLHVLGGWDMYTQNYYDLKSRYNLEGNYLDLLKDNVYLVNANVGWKGHYYSNFPERVIEFIKEHYKVEAKYELVENFEYINIYKFSLIED